MKIIVILFVAAIPSLSGKKPEVFQDKEIAKRNTESTPSKEFVSESNENQERTFFKTKEALEEIQMNIFRLQDLGFKTASLNHLEWACEILKQEKKLAQLKEAIENKLMQQMEHNTMKSGWKSDMGEKKQEDPIKKVESNLHVAASNQMAHVIKPKAMPSADSGLQNTKKTVEGERENNQPSAPKMNSMWQQMGQSRNSQQECMRPNESHAHTEHDQDFVSFMKASDEHNQRFHSTNQNIHQESPVGSHGIIPQKRYAEMANAEWHIQNRWQELRSSGGAYGPSLGYGIPPTSGDSGSGAVAVFPNAKAGNCGIPLLLSCSPSVVSGTLSKASSYSAPVYRAEIEHT